MSLATINSAEPVGVVGKLARFIFLSAIILSPDRQKEIAKEDVRII
jgi:hypothetical protein